MLGLLLFLATSVTANPAPIEDPIPEKIPPGDIVVAVEDFVRAPRTYDSSDQGANATNTAYARIQNIQPFGNTTGRLIINDTRGVLYLTNQNGSDPTVFLDLRQQDVGFFDAAFPNEMGLAGVAFHPEFTALGAPGFGKFYTAYSARTDQPMYHAQDAGSHMSVIREWTMFNPRATVFEGTSRLLFSIGEFAPNHNVGAIAFNPAAEKGTPDYGMLYAAFGDGGAANDPRGYGQDLASPHAAIIRIDPMGRSEHNAYAIPADNPLLGEQLAAPELWAWGLRHAQHFSWDSRGRMFISDIGQNQVEEVNLGRRGANYGWRLREGSFAAASAVSGGTPGLVYPLSAIQQSPTETDFAGPIAQYDHDEGRAIGGGYVYEGSSIPALRGKFVFSDLVTGRLFYIDVDAIDINALAGNGPLDIRELRLSFDRTERSLASVAHMSNTYRPGQRVDLRLGTDAFGELYLLTKADGWIRKLSAADSTP